MFDSDYRLFELPTEARCHILKHNPCTIVKQVSKIAEYRFSTKQRPPQIKEWPSDCLRIYFFPAFLAAHIALAAAAIFALASGLMTRLTALVAGLTAALTTATGLTAGLGAETGLTGALAAFIFAHLAFCAATILARPAALIPPFFTGLADALTAALTGAVLAFAALNLAQRSF